MIKLQFKIHEVKCCRNCPVLKLTVYTDVSRGDALPKEKYFDVTESISLCTANVSIR